MYNVSAWEKRVTYVPGRRRGKSCAQASVRVPCDKASCEHERKAKVNDKNNCVTYYVVARHRSRTLTISYGKYILSISHEREKRPEECFFLKSSVRAHRTVLLTTGCINPLPTACQTQSASIPEYTYVLTIEQLLNKNGKGQTR